MNEYLELKGATILIGGVEIAECTNEDDAYDLVDRVNRFVESLASEAKKPKYHKKLKGFSVIDENTNSL